MKTSIAYKNLDLREPVESEFEKQRQKLNRLLQTYSPDLVQLHGTVEQHSRKEEFAFSLNLSLPTGSLQAGNSGPDLRQCIKRAFSDLARQLKRHQSLLRRDFEWKRKRGRAEAALAGS
jgi:ribosome-associated translation inhibitor RaiA